jgi:predicted RNA-binding protein with RPS1 domain
MFLMSQELKVGQKYQLKILSIEPLVHKMALSLVRPEISQAITEKTQDETSQDQQIN